jgi:hypothetical protein
LASNLPKTSKILHRSITWREREHEEVESFIVDGMEVIIPLHAFVLLKILYIPNMQAEKQLLQLLIRYYDLDQDYFMIDDEPLKIEFENICFITSLYWPDALVKLKGWT